MWRLIKWTARLIFILVVVSVGAGGYLFYRAMPSYSGTVSLPGLSAETRVWRDGYGVPHIFSANMNDAARALGYLHASERLLQMELQRRVGQGRVAELNGPDFVGVDRFMRVMGFYRQAERSFEAFSPLAQERLKAYAEGVNAFLDSHRDALPPEFLILGDKPEPWVPADTLVFGKLLSYQNSNNYKLEALRARLGRKFSREQIGWLLPGAPKGGPITTNPIVNSSHGALEERGRSVDDRIGELTGMRHGASNEWTVSGSRTVSGKPILANDPHLSIGAPILWYLARIVTPEGWVKGATAPGAPVVLLGQNDSIAWGITNSDTDAEDLFVETLDPANPEQYLTPDGPKPFDLREETIHINGAPDIILRVRSTRHGPVLSDIDADLAAIAGPGKVVALAFTGFSERDTTVESVLRIDAARNWSQFLDALKLWVAPRQNFAYADVSGDIGYFNPGPMPLRKSGDGLTPADGASGAMDWVGVVPFEQLPQLHNPDVGFVFNANNAVVADDHQPTFGQDWEENFRARRLQQFFDTIDKHSLDTSAAMQADRLSLDAKDLAPFLKTIQPTDERARQALALLSNWDGVMDKSRVEPLIHTAFVKSLRHILLEEKAGEPLDDIDPFSVTPMVGLLRDHPEWCDAPGKPDPGCRATLTRALDEALALLVKRDGADMSQWRWGDEHVAILKHRIFGQVPLLDWLSDLSVASSGGFYTLDRGGGFETPPDRPFARTHAAGYRGLYDLGDPDKSRFIIATGQSGHIFSSHYRDLVAMWNDVKSIPLSGSEEALKNAGAQELVFH